VFWRITLADGDEQGAVHALPTKFDPEPAYRPLNERVVGRLLAFTAVQVLDLAQLGADIMMLLTWVGHLFFPPLSVDGIRVLKRGW
jgi:hypothetical protein